MDAEEGRETEKARWIHGRVAGSAMKSHGNGAWRRLMRRHQSDYVIDTWPDTRRGGYPYCFAWGGGVFGARPIFIRLSIRL